MEIVSWLQQLAKSASAEPGFHPRPAYVLCCVALPIAWGLLMGLLLRLAEAVIGVEFRRGGTR